MNCPSRCGPMQLEAELIRGCLWFRQWQSARAGEDVRKFTAGEGDGIRLHAAGVGGFLDQFRIVRRRETVTAQRGNLEMGDERAHPGNSVVGNGGFPAGEKTGDDFVTAESFAGRLTFTQSRKICAHDMREKRGANGAVGRGQEASNGPGQSMDGTQPCIGQGKSAEQTGEGHVFAGAVVAAVVKGSTQRARGAGDAVPAEGVGYGIGTRADKRFDELGEGIQSGAGGEGRGQIAGQFRINDSNAREYERTAEADFEAVFGRSKDGVAGDFGTGAGGGGNGNERRGRFCKRLATTDDFKVIEKFAAIGKQGGDSLAGVDGAATAKGNYEVATFARGRCETVADGLNFRLASHWKDDVIHAMLAQKFEQRSGAKGVASSDDQGAPAEFGGERAGIADGTPTEDNAIGGGEFKAHIGDDIHVCENRRGQLQLEDGYFFMANMPGLRHSRRSL
jgi:hypothetical protein